MTKPFLGDLKKGALHRQLGYPKGEKIPTGLLRDIVRAPEGNIVRGTKATGLLKKRANLALTMRSWR
jgi:hypothetical protein